jgi:hypothetical protein
VRVLTATALLGILTEGVNVVMAQTASTAIPSARRSSLAVEADVLAYGISGSSGIVSYSFGNGLQVAAGVGNYDVPTFLLEGDAQYDAARWKARSTSVQVMRATYRLNGPMKNGLALGAVVLNRRWRLTSETLPGAMTFRPLSAALTAGYTCTLVVASTSIPRRRSRTTRWCRDRRRSRGPATPWPRSGRMHRCM